jgi:archaellin
MQFWFSPDSPDNQRGSVAIEVAIIAIAGFIIAILGAMALLGASFMVTNSGEEVVRDGITASAAQLTVRTGLIAESGEVDVDGNNTIDLGGVDELAVAKIEFVVEVSSDLSVDLTPPMTTDDTQTEPDASGLTPKMFVSLSWDEFTTNAAEWTVSFAGDNNGDYYLDQGERAEITIWLHQYDGNNVLYDLGAGSSDGYVDTATELLQKRDEFTIELLVEGSTSLLLNRTLPLELGTSDLLD